MPQDLEAMRQLVTPVVASMGLSLFDVEVTGAGRARTLRVVIDREGGVDLDTISDATRALQPVLTDAGTLRDTDVLEVSSPGLERPLKRPEHYRAAVGSAVSVKYRRDGETVRTRATLVAADDGGVDLTLDDGAETARIAYDEIVAARTVFEWGPAPRPGRGSKPGKGGARRPKEHSRS